jgi:hypothetical protein
MTGAAIESVTVIGTEIESAREVVIEAEVGGAMAPGAADEIVRDDPPRRMTFRRSRASRLI